jgi:hypothetical protein
MCDKTVNTSHDMRQFIAISKTMFISRNYVYLHIYEIALTV